MAASECAVEYQVRGSVAVLSVRHPPVNSLSTAVFALLKNALAQANADAGVRSIVLVGHGATFPAGADISEFPRLKQRLSAGAPVRLDEVPQLLEDSSKLVVAAIHGTALGGGLEIALGCHFRIALASARFGQPEVQLGLIPGAGGTQRLPRLIGVPDALQMITTGAPISAPKALKLGLIDWILPKDKTSRDDLINAAIVFAQETAAGGISLDERRISNWPVLPEVPEAVFMHARKTAMKAARGFEAPLACIEAVEACARLPFSQGIVEEGRIFKRALLGKQAAAQQHIFFSQRACSRVPGIDPRLSKRIQSVGIIGAGTMGGGIAMNFIQVGIRVVMLEVKQEFLDRGLSVIKENYQTSVKRRKMKPQQMQQYLSLLQPTLDYNDLSTVDIVIEAVFEDMNIKKQVLAKLDQVCKPDAIICTNTSTLDVDEIASATKRPGSVVGTHFFSPANKMKLLENVRGSKSSAEALATVMAMGKTIKKIPVLVGNCFGFVGNRMIEWYGRESAYLVEEGASVQQVDAALFKFGMPMGPFSMADLAGNDITHKIRKSLGLLDEKTRPKNERYHGSLGDTLVAMGRLGIKTQKGWYAYKGRRGIPDPIVDQLIAERRKSLGIPQRRISDQEIVERCIFPLINEGFKILEEGIAVRPGDIDIVLVYGYGFPAYRGGPMHYGDSIGLDKVAAALAEYGRQHSNVSHWKVSPLLAQLVQQRKTLAQFTAEKQRRANL